MLRKDYKQIQEQTCKILEDVQAKANAAGLEYIICMWESPFNKGRIEKRVGYFEEINEADHMKDCLAQTYIKYQFPFYITTSYTNDEDGGLFDD